MISSGPPKMSRAQMIQAERQQELSMMAMQQMQLTRTIWMLAKQAGGTVTIDEAQMDPLWEVKYERPTDGDKTKLTVIASAMPTPSDEQIELLAKILLGTGKNPSDEMINVGLVDYPLSYLVNRLKAHIEWDDATKLWAKTKAV
jgi:hypothetical protein